MDANDKNLEKKSSLKDTSLPDPADQPNADVVIFDGQCNFCRSQVEKLHWFSANQLAFISLHDPRVQQNYPNLTYEQLMAQIYVVTRTGEQLGGMRGIRYLSRKHPRLWWAVPMLHIPGTLGIWQWLYDRIAQIRYRLAGKADDCEGGSCEIHFGGGNHQESSTP